jgi:hypothetical protein
MLNRNYTFKERRTSASFRELLIPFENVAYGL